MRLSLFAFIVFFTLITAPLRPLPLCAEYLPEPDWVYKGRGDRYFREGEYGKAIDSYKKALIKRKNSSSDTQNRGYPEVNIQLARVYMLEGLHDFALLHLETAERQKEFLQISDLSFTILYTRADIFSLQKKYDKLLKVYEEILKLDEYKDIYFQQNSYTLPSRFIEDPELGGKFGRAYFELGKLKINSQNFDSAISYFKMALTYHYKPEQTLDYLVYCYKKSYPVMVERVLKLKSKI
jgi:tetratricopeptide (TPR) repeat protein